MAEEDSVMVVDLDAFLLVAAAEKRVGSKEVSKEGAGVEARGASRAGDAVAGQAAEVGLARSRPAAGAGVRMARSGAASMALVTEA